MHPEFESIDKADRSKFNACLSNLEAIKSWRETLPPSQRLKLNYPPTVLARWKASLSSGEESEEQSESSESKPDPVQAFVEIWKKMTGSERIAAQRKILPDLLPEDLLEAMSAEYRAQIHDRVGGLQLAHLKATQPNTKVKNVKRKDLPVVHGVDNVVHLEFSSPPPAH